MQFALPLRSDDFFMGDTIYVELAQSILEKGRYGVDYNDVQYPPGLPGLPRIGVRDHRVRLLGARPIDGDLLSRSGTDRELLASEAEGQGCLFEIAEHCVRCVGRSLKTRVVSNDCIPQHRSVGARFRVKPTKSFNFMVAALPMILLLGFALRLHWMITQTPIMSDGTLYVRVAENLISGNGPIGLWGEPDTMYGLLFPFLIAGTATVVPSAETAAHVVALVFGTALIATVFQIAHLMYGRRTAYICALLVAGHPLLVKVSASVYNETIYMTLLMASIYFGLRTLELQTYRCCVLCGLCLGLAYLARPEAAAYPFLLALALCAAGFAHKKLKPAMLAAAIVVGAFTVVASPYVAYLYKETGSLRLEGKWNINYTNARRLLLGMDIAQAAFGIDNDLNVEGPLLEPRKFANYTPYPHSLEDKIHTLVANAKRNMWTIYAEFTEGAIGYPALAVLIVLGLFRKSWSNRRLAHEAVLSTVAMSIVFLLLTATETAFRYFLPLLPILLIWAGKGVEEVGEWARGSEVLTSNLVPRPNVVSMGLQACLVIAIFGLSALGTRSLWEISSRSDPNSVAARDAGLWLREHWPGPKRVAAWISIVPYYADATMVLFPYGDPEPTLRYLKAKHPDFVVLESHRRKKPPAIDDWIAGGIPDDQARVIYDSTNSAGDRIVIYSWKH